MPKILLSIFSLIIISFLSLFIIFIILEKRPSLIQSFNAQNIKYFSLISKYIPDEKLIFTYSKKPLFYYGWYNGDQYKPEYMDKADKIKYSSKYDSKGFRLSTFGTNPDYKIVLIGDSFIEIGEDDKSTITTYIESITSIPVMNLGRAWYGPHQYLELLKRYALTKTPVFAIFSFYSGNDIDDIREYTDWENGNKYYFYEDYSKFSVPKRFLIALSQTYEFIKQRFDENQSIALSNTQIHPDLGLIKIGNENLKMAFAKWNNKHNSQDLILKSEWKELKSLLANFKIICLQNNIIPVVLYIPSKLEVYGNLHQKNSGKKFMSKIKTQLKYQDNASMTLKSITDNINIDYINLLPEFRTLAANGELLYYRYDTHWNKSGRKQAANIISNKICTHNKLDCKKDSSQKQDM